MTNDLRIADAPLLVDVSGEEKLPTGGYGNYSTTINQIADFTQLKWKLATEGYVNNEISVVTNKLNNHTQDKTNPHGVTKEQVGLGEVDNTADLDKPVSAYQQSAIDEKIAKTSIVDNLTTNESNKVLSAKQGKVLQDNKSEKAVTKFSVKTKAELSTLVGTEIVYVDEVKGVYKVDSTSTSSGNGYSTILDSKNRRWVLQDMQKYMDFFDKGKSPKVYASAYKMGLGRQDYGNFEISMRQQLDGSGYGTQLYNSTVTTTDNEAQVKNFRYYDNVDPSNYAIKDRVRDDGIQPYYCEYNNIHTTGCNGMEIIGVEPLIKNVRIGSNSRDDRVDYGIRATKKSSGDAFTSIDLSLANIYTQGCKTGFSVRGAYHLVDGHFVWANVGMRIEGSNSETSLPDQKVTFGAYLDKSYSNGMYLYGASGTTTYSPHFYESGLYQTDTSVAVSGLRLEQICNNNFFSAPTFNTQDLSKVTTLIWLDPSAKNNTFIHPMGSYKMRDADSLRMRRQTVAFGTGSWAKHNNVMRQLRASSGSVAVDAEVTLSFLSDYHFPLFEGTNNFILFKGHYASRTFNGATQYGEIFLTSSDNTTDYGATHTMTMLSGNEHNKWQIVSFTRVGAELTLVLKNVGTSASQIGIELQRSVDAKGFTF